jgi:hypothetical protein
MKVTTYNQVTTTESSKGRKLRPCYNNQSRNWRPCYDTQSRHWRPCYDTQSRQLRPCYDNQSRTWRPCYDNQSRNWRPCYYLCSRKLRQVTTYYQFNCISVALHLAFVRNVHDSTERKKIKSRHYYSSSPWEFPPPPPCHLDLGEYRHNTRLATIALTATSPTTILTLGSVRFPVFYEESHHFYRPNFVTRRPSWPGGRKIGFQGR